MSLFRNEENKEMETRAAIEVNALRASESSSGFDELAEQLEDEMGCGLYCRYRGVFNSISAEVCFVRILPRHPDPDLFLYGQIETCITRTYMQNSKSPTSGILHTRPRFFRL